jgi:hypothetical protein
MTNEPPITIHNNDLRNYVFGAVTDMHLEGATGPTGPTGVAGATGPSGASGATGPSGAGLVSAADFYATMPADNAAPIAVGAAVEFPNDGAIFGPDISRLSSSTFQLAAVGYYKVDFQASVTGTSQLILKLNAAEIASTCSGASNGNVQLVGVSIVQVTVPNSVLSVVVPAGNANAVTLTANAGDAHAANAHLVIARLS